MTQLKQDRYLSILIVLAVVVSMLPVAAAAVEATYTENWDGRGSDSMNCSKIGEGPRTSDGWIHWIFSTKGDSTNAILVLGGTGSGTYYPAEPLTANTWHFYTPFFNVTGLNATISLYGGEPGTGGGLVISDYCPGDGGNLQETLEVRKTVDTSYDRTHFWFIDKSVDTDNGYEHYGFPKIWLYIDGSGNENATWTVNVNYTGSDDSDYKVSGTIIIENNGDLPANITSIVDELNGTIIDLDCGITFPYLLPVGENLTCTYSEDVNGMTEGYNNVTVTTFNATRSVQYLEYSANPVPIVWGEPEEEFNKEINVTDNSELFGSLDLGNVTAPNNRTFTYSGEFAWADYGKTNCGDFIYNNTATIIETEQSANATLKVNVQCYDYETAYAKGNDSICFIPTFAQWGWTNPVMPGTYTMDLWAAAAQCDTSKGTLVGNVTVTYTPGSVVVVYNVESPYILEESHVYAGTTMFPQVMVGKKNVNTVAPGQYYINIPAGYDGELYIIAHGVVGIPDPDFGP
jgi:hypothetical protein